MVRWVTLCPLRGGFARGAAIWNWSGGPLPSRSAQGAIHIPFPPQVGHIPRQAPRFPREDAGGRDAPRLGEEGREGAMAIVLMELRTSSRSRSATERRGARAPQPAEPVRSLEGQLPEGALLSTDGHSEGWGAYSNTYMRNLEKRETLAKIKDSTPSVKEGKVIGSKLSTLFWLKLSDVNKM
ncbi:unnamed protein product [Rangifer tarandus platyrhynchus]|uniref:Uncharacterized protein n=1 Tax=Rangifer tarandus platyrhynchus TaxID=3082113 RepID=A0AC59Y1P2_RANTA